MFIPQSYRKPDLFTSGQSGSDSSRDCGHEYPVEEKREPADGRTAAAQAGEEA
jgi:hypothetical protein